MAIVRQDVIDRLAQLGYVAGATDYDQLDFEMEVILNYTKNFTNLTTIPAIVEPRVIDRICSEFLFYKKNSGTLTGFDYDVAVKELKEGDTTVKYAMGADGETPESRFDNMVNNLQRGFDKWLTPHRKLRW